MINKSTHVLNPLSGECPCVRCQDPATPEERAAFLVTLERLAAKDAKILRGLAQ